MGWETVFAHCPVCKAPARLPRWAGPYPRELYTCPTCDNEYSPAATAAAKRMEYSSPDLREIMGAKFPEFARFYLVARGASEANAALIVAAHEAWEKSR